MSEFSCCSQLPNDLQIERPGSNNGLSLVFPLLDVYILEVAKPLGESEGTETCVRVGTHSRPGLVQEHVTVSALQAYRQMSGLQGSVSPNHRIVLTFQVGNVNASHTVHTSLPRRLQLIHFLSGVRICWHREIPGVDS